MMGADKGTEVIDGLVRWANNDALFKTTSLFRRVAIEVSNALGYDYPYDLDNRVTSYLQRVRRLEQ